MSNITLEQEELAVITELDDEKMVALVGGGSSKPPIKWPKPPKPEQPEYHPSKGYGALIKLNIDFDLDLGLGLSLSNLLGDLL
ncbi:MAG: hypothetical protein RM347_029770 [Nostoc sp. ChiQUE02]|uniref:hypothetical protein n=1 Tax=Nostoc sp. ChiQUE02 TaxID=3075377 RepID=UPI002AD277B0|nr:hypothetical protein [Nostoc sp. ChiQUE02]MDZ8228844.1 hypothetical protein [Nostoc sp. ChiQUE02]